ncbi:MAG: PQQ-binding-like beta-propeller repeat protein [bacterium]|nr:PQQ-binding-like beta-propeller repeat protein [bacterium]MDW8105233.1 PQQ-binding-like beta-propeller repeat protein [Armatimonadota bacterium]
MRMGWKGFVATVGALVCLMTSAVIAQDVLTYRYSPTHEGVASGDIQMPVAMHWRYTASPAPQNAAAPAIVGNTIYYACRDRFYALDAETGRVLWRYPVDQPLNAQFRTTPAVSEGIVYVGATDGNLYALSAETGRYLWAFRTQGAILSHPTVVNDVVYFGSADGRVYAVNAKTGEPIWRGGFRTNDAVNGAVAVEDDMVYFISADQTLYAAAAPTGLLLWRLRLPGTLYALSPVVSERNVYVVASNVLYALQARSGRQLWARTLPDDIVTEPIAGNGLIYVLTRDGRVYAFDSTGKLLWNSKEPVFTHPVLAPPTLAGNVLIIGTARGGIYALDASNGNVLWKYLLQSSSSTPERPTFTDITATPVVSGRTLYVVSDDGSLTAFRSDAPDNIPPTVTEIEPARGIAMSGAPPIRFRALISDDGSGVKTDTIQFLLDDQPVKFEFDLARGEITYLWGSREATVASAGQGGAGATTVRPLSDGRHTVKIIVEDWRGNRTEYSWSFIVDNTLRKRPATTQPRTQPAAPGVPSGRRGGGGRGGDLEY